MQSMQSTADGNHPRRWLTLVAMTGSLSMIFIDITVVGVALPQIQTDLGMNDVSIQWVVSIYTLALACLVALGGRVADLIGRVPSFVVGVIIFALASAACGMAASAAVLIAARAVQGVGAALMQPASGALVIGSFAPGSRGKAMAVYVGIPLLFMVIGPVLGGVITQAASWRWCFWINLPIAAVSLVLTAMARPADRRSASRRIDPLALMLLLIGLPALVLGVQQGSDWGWFAPWLPSLAADAWPLQAVSAVPLMLFGLALLAWFVVSEWRKREPLLAIGLFRDHGLLANALVLFLMQFALNGLVIHGSTYAQHVLAYSPRQAGMSLLPLLIPTLFVVHVAGRLYDRIGVRRPALIGTVGAAIGGVIAALGAWMMYYPIIAIGMAVIGAGVGFVMSPTNTDSMSRVPADARAQVSGLIQTMRHMGGTVGLAVIGAAVLVVRTRLGADTSVGRAVDDAARQTLATSVAVGYALGALACAGAAIASFALHPRGRSEGRA